MAHPMLVATVGEFITRFNEDRRFNIFWTRKGWDVVLGNAVYTDPQGKVHTYAPH